MIEGVDSVIKELLKFGKEAEEMIELETEEIGREITLNAKRNAANSLAGLDDRTKKQASDLDQGISSAFGKDKGVFSEISQNLLPMGAYIEFGTGTYVEVDPEWKDLAWQFYVNGKGRLHAAPYLWPAFEKGRKVYIDRLQKELDFLTNRFNESR